MRDNNDMAHTAQFDRAQEIDTDEPCARPVAVVRTPEETAAALARRFHEGFAASVADVAAGVAHAAGLTKAALGGGVFSNRIVCELVKRSLEAAHLKVYLPTSLPLNDGGISYGQAAVARARMASAILNQANEQE